MAGDSSDAPMVVQVQSAGFDAGNMAKIVVNNVPVEVEKNHNGHFRGLHVALISP